jgi:hypothetical protein
VGRGGGSIRITRSRVDGTAQTASTAIPRNEKICTDAKTSIAM